MEFNSNMRILARLLTLALLLLLGLACSGRVRSLPTPSATSSSSLSSSTPSDSPAKRKALYYPNAKVYGERPSGARELDILTSDGLTLKAWCRPAPKDGKLIVYFHGNGGNLTALGAQLKVFEKLEVGYLAVDYRGFGQSQGDPSEAGLYLDAEATYRKAIELGYPPHRLVIFGRSLGGGVATYLASREPTAGLVLESTFTSVQDVARRTHGVAAAALVSGFPSLERMPEITMPTLIIHGDKDTTIPSDMAGTLAKASPQAEVWMVEGADHNTVRKIAGETYTERLRQFLDALPSWSALQSVE